MAITVDIAFPFRQDTEGFPQPVTEPRVVVESVIQILLTARGERVFRPNFGCDLPQFVFENDTPALRAAVAREVFESLTTWEPRVDNLGVALSFNDSTVDVDVSFSITTTNDRAAVRFGFPRRQAA